MKNLRYIGAGIGLILLAAGCKPDLEAPKVQTGSLDLSHYVAAGDYLTAGFANGGLTPASQQVAYPNILARQFALAGAPSGFQQPIIGNGGTQTITLQGFNTYGFPQLSGTEEFKKLITLGCSTAPVTPLEQYSTTPEQTAALQNFGVPGLLLNQIRKAGLGNNANAGTPANYNPYFDRMLPNGDNRTYVQTVSGSNASFFTLWVGMSNMVTYALSGATCTNGMPAGTVFKSEVTVLLDSLSQIRKNSAGKFVSTRKGVICNLPSIRDFGFAQLTDPKALEKRYQQEFGIDSICIRRRKIQFVAGLYETHRIRFDEIILQKGLQSIGQEVTVTVNGVQMQVRHGLHPESPLENDEVLDVTEIGEIEFRISEYNKEIGNLLANATYKNSVILADMKGLIAELKNRVNYNGVKYSMQPFTGGISTLDFITFSPRGQAFLANKIIQSMNREVTKDATSTGFGTNIQEINVNDFPLLQIN